MLTIRPMASGDRDAVMAMVTDFYHSPAVEHQVDPAILERAFWDAVDPAQPLIEGLLLLEADPGLERRKHRPLLERVKRMFSDNPDIFN